MTNLTNKNNQKPIGIFDSGIGGLTVAQSLVKQLPYEHIIYFGDTAHMPYGDKSAESICAYALKITKFLLQQECKLILMACHTASSVAFDVVKQFVDGKALLMDVVNPVVDHVRAFYAKKCIGLIGTKAMIHSNIYQKKFDQFNADITLKSQATSILASAIEEGFHEGPVIDSILEAYLSHETLNDIDALILGCTHYPIIKENIRAFYKNTVDIIDPSDIVAHAVCGRLSANQLLNADTNPSVREFYISDYTKSFSENIGLFFKDDIHLKHHPIWE